MIILKGSPLSTNSIYRRRKGFGIYMTKEGHSLKESYQWEATSQWKDKMMRGDIEVCIKLYFKNYLRRDWDNWHKLSMDALTGIVWEDDSQIKKATVEMCFSKENPRIEIDIKKFSTE